jgi:flagellar motor switch protein FliG
MASSVSARTVTSLKALAGPEKAAALLLYMGKPFAARLLKHFDGEE